MKTIAKVPKTIIRDEIFKYYKDSITKKHGSLNFAAYSQISNEAPGNIINVPLLDIFLPFDFSTYGVQKKRLIKSSEMLTDSNNKVILAGPGYGKTTFLKFVLLNIIIKKIVPVYWEWKNLYRRIYEDTDFRTVVFEYFKERLKDYFKEEEIESFIQGHKFIFLIDGFDEVAASDLLPPLKSILKNYKKKYPKDYFVIASRIANYPREYFDLFSELEFQHFEINPLKEHLIFQYINRFINLQFPDDKLRSAAKIEFLSKCVESQPGIKKLAEHPLLLNLIVLIYTFEGSLPDTKVNLYNRCIEVLIYVWKKSDRDIKVFNELHLDNNSLYLLLSEVAYKYFEKFIDGRVKEFGVLPGEELKETISKAYISLIRREIQDSEINTLIEKLFNHFKNETGVIVEISPDCFGFSHLTLLEYLTAQYIVNERGDFNRNLQYILKVLKNKRFKEIQEVIIFQVELMGKSTSNLRFTDILAKRLVPGYKKQKDYSILILLAKLLKDDQDFSINDTKEILKLVTIYRAKHPENKEITSLINDIFMFSEKARICFVELLSKSAKEIEIWENFSLRTAHRIGNRVFSIISDLNIIEKEYRKKKANENISSIKIEKKISKIREEIKSLNINLAEYRDFASEIEFANQEYNIDSMIREIIKKFRQVYLKVKITYSSKDNSISAFTDKYRIEQVIEELIENSIKYSKVERLKISLSLECIDDTFIVHFKNNGRGIPKKNKHKIFEPFYSTDSKSIGLGLANAKKIVESLNGEIKEVGEEKRGVHFILSFNISRR